MSRLGLLAGLVLVLVACPDVAARRALLNCHFDLRRVELARLSLTDTDLDLGIGVTNPNDLEAFVDRFDYTLFVDDQRAATGSSPGNLRIPIGQSRDLLVHAKVSHLDAAGVIAKLLRGGRHRATLRGTAYVAFLGSEHQFPITLEREFDVPSKPPFYFQF